MTTRLLNWWHRSLDQTLGTLLEDWPRLSAPGLLWSLVLLWASGAGELVQAQTEPQPLRTLSVESARAAGIEETFTAGDGAELGYVSYTSERASTALVYLHGIESHAGWFAIAAVLLRNEGYDVFCLDRRGSGINRENRGFVSGHVDAYQILFDDLKTFVTSLRARYASVYLVGLSWGGKLAMGYALANPADVDGLILITPGIRSRLDVSLFTKLKILLYSWSRPRAPIKTPIEPEMFTTTPRFLRFIQQDPLRLTHATARFFLETRKLDNHVDELMPGNRLPVQVFLAGKDRIIDNEGVLRVLQAGVQKDLEVVVYEDQTHSVQFD